MPVSVAAAPRPLGARCAQPEKRRTNKAKTKIFFMIESFVIIASVKRSVRCKSYSIGVKPTPGFAVLPFRLARSAFYPLNTGLRPRFRNLVGRGRHPHF